MQNPELILFNHHLGTITPCSTQNIQIRRRRDGQTLCELCLFSNVAPQQSRRSLEDHAGHATGSGRSRGLMILAISMVWATGPRPKGALVDLLK